MIKLNGEPVQLGSFPDGSMLLRQTPPKTDPVQIAWYYESDRETLGLVYLVNHLKAHGCRDLDLYLPYLPNARQDRVKTEEDVFTLKYFAGLLNSLGLRTVTVLDPHSNVSEALIEHIVVQKPQKLIEAAIEKITALEGEAPSMFYPDEGAGKRYSGMIPLPYAFGIKKRDWKSGQILGLDVAGAVENIRDRNILIVDDICSRGGTFYHSAKRLKELGAKHIYLYISHCENGIFDGELLKGDLIQKIYTTNSILTREHPMIEITRI